ncbi:hypothetical protein N0V88_003401 [Collariella sp. IMI 366227]|nr:hypothetical protein N0V88_003401 [Collariella sp. IMI 366227]
MCDYIQREYSCQHFRWIASKWCRIYTITHKRCPPNITHYECVLNMCGNCKSKNEPPVPWEAMIRRPGQREVRAL